MHFMAISQQMGSMQDAILRRTEKVDLGPVLDAIARRDPQTDPQTLLQPLTEQINKLHDAVLAYKEEAPLHLTALKEAMPDWSTLYREIRENRVNRVQEADFKHLLNKVD